MKMARIFKKGVVTLLAASCLAVPMLTASVRMALAESPVIYGDVSGDGKINSTDLSLMKRAVLGIASLSGTAAVAGDLNGDGSVNSVDYSLLKRYILGTIITFPVVGTQTPTPTPKPTPTPTPTASANIPWNWTGIIGTGQSLSIGCKAQVVSKTQPYNNLKLSLGTAKVPPFDPTSSSLKMVPLVEPIRDVYLGFPGPYPTNINGETPHSSMANQITSMVKGAFGTDYISVHTVVGEGGQGMAQIKKGATDTGSVGRAYAASIFEVTAINRLAKAAGKTYGVGGIILTHGENDSSSSTYEYDIHQLWSDYNNDIKAITGQTQSIPLFATQQHSYPGTASTLATWKAGVDYPGDIICVGPKYQYSYYTDAVHLNAIGYQELGEKYAEVYYNRVVLKNDWKPLEPTSATKSGNVITVNFNVPVLPLAWDTTLQAPNQSVNEWKNGKGFEVTASGSKVTISSVAISGSSVQITCANNLPSSGVKVAYALTSQTARSGGTIRWGLLRDSDPFKGSSTGVAQPNYCVSFEMQVP